MGSTEFVDRGTDTPVLYAVKSTGELLQRTAPNDKNKACEYAGPRIVNTKTGYEIAP
ncbi:hypothetical protein Plhal304r1_c048g0130181 [Plasmopara halstedii]